MGVKSAKYGTASWTAPSGGQAAVIADVRNIEVTESAGAQEYGSSSTNGKTGREAGREDKTVTFDMYFEALADIPFSKGDKGTLTVTSDGSTELYNEASLITELGKAVPIEEGGLLSCSVSVGQQAG